MGPGPHRTNEPSMGPGPHRTNEPSMGPGPHRTNETGVECLPTGSAWFSDLIFGTLIVSTGIFRCRDSSYLRSRLGSPSGHPPAGLMRRPLRVVTLTRGAAAGRLAPA